MKTALEKKKNKPRTILEFLFFIFRRDLDMQRRNMPVFTLMEAVYYFAHFDLTRLEMNVGLMTLVKDRGEDE